MAVSDSVGKIEVRPESGGHADHAPSVFVDGDKLAFGEEPDVVDDMRFREQLLRREIGEAKALKFSAGGQVLNLGVLNQYFTQDAPLLVCGSCRQLLLSDMREPRYCSNKACKANYFFVDRVSALVSGNGKQRFGRFVHLVFA
jgi:hypothetical protein